jgi:hypothetical protein
MKNRTIYCVFLLAATLFGGAAPALAGDEPSTFEKMLSRDQQLNTKESVVEMHGQKFRKIEYKDNVYYLQMLAAQNSTSDLVLLCSEESAAGFNQNSPPLIQASARINKRTRVFIEGLKQSCTNSAQGSPTISPNAKPMIGLQLEDSDPNATLKNRRVFINPQFLESLNFSAEW